MERKLLVLVMIISLANFERRNIPKEIQKKLANHFLNCSPQNFALLDQIFITKRKKWRNWEYNVATYNLELNMTMRWWEGKMFLSPTHGSLPLFFPSPTCHGTFFHYRMTTLFFLILFPHCIVKRHFSSSFVTKIVALEKSLRKLKATLVF